MKSAMTPGAALLLTTGIASAGGIDRTGNAYSVLFEDGNYAQLSFSSVTPDVTGEYPGGMLGTGSTGNMAQSYLSSGFALKYGITDQLDLGLFINQPFGADADYRQGFYEGLSAQWDSTQIAALAKYQAAPGISVYGGLRAVQSKATIAIPDSLIRLGLAMSGTQQAEALAANAPAGTLAYAAETESNLQFGYVIGAAYERPEIALRVALTYESGMTHDFDTTESMTAVPSVNGESVTDIELPQTLALDFQTGVAADTLVFGSIRWSEWSVWEVRPQGYEGLTGNEVTGIDNDVITYRLGVGRKINDAISVFGRVTYEQEDGGVASRLAPTDGSISYGFGGSYTFDNIKVSGGIEYALLGDATDGTSVAFTDNTAIGIGINIGYSF